MADEFKRWRHALAGNPMDFGERGDPASGYYRNPTSNGMEAVCIYRDGENIQCIRNVFGDGSKMTADEIDELFGDCGRYPISYQLYTAVAENGEPWPEIHTTVLRTKDIKAGVVWTEAWARARLAENPETHDADGNPLPPRNHNNPPEELSPDRALAKRIYDLGLQLAEWLKGIGGAPTNQAEAELLAGYANRFKDFENESAAAHKAEKEPFLKAGREVDAKWFAPVRDKAIASRTRVLDLINAFTRAEDAKRAEAARLANEAARKAAETQARATDEPPVPAPVFTPEPTKVSTLRRGTLPKAKSLVADLKPFLAYCASLENPPPDIVEAAEKVAKKWRSDGIQVPGMSEKERASA